MFCTNCGSQAESGTRFCPSCGKPMEGPAQAAQPPAYTPPPPQSYAPQPAAAPRKGLGPIAWILIVIGGVFALGMVTCVAGGLFLAHKVKQAGFDPALIERHPELAVLKMAVAANPDAEIVKIDEDRGIVSVRNKKDNKVLTFNFEDIRNGRFSLEDENGKKMTLNAQGQGDKGTLEITTDQGTAKIGAGVVKLPSWLPAYSGAKVDGLSTESATGSSGTFTFKTNDAADRVASYYESELKKAGFTVELTKLPAGAMVTGESGQKKAVINVTTEGSGSTVSGTFDDK